MASDARPSTSTSTPSRGVRPGHVVSKREADDWERRIRTDWKQGLDPRKPPPVLTDGSSLLVAMRDYAAFEIPELSVPDPAWSEMRHIVLFFGGERSVTDLEREAVVAPFKIALEDGWRPARRRAKEEPDGNELGEGHGPEQGPLTGGRGVVAVDRILQRLRHFTHWCMHQLPPRMMRSPFHQFGVTIDTSNEESRSRRLHEGEETALLAACDLINDEQHWFAGLPMKRRILGARWLGARGSELDRVRTSTDIDFKTWRVKIRAGKSKKPRTIWLSDESPLRESPAPTAVPEAAARSGLRRCQRRRLRRPERLGNGRPPGAQQDQAQRSRPDGRAGGGPSEGDRAALPRHPAGVRLAVVGADGPKDIHKLSSGWARELEGHQRYSA